MMPAHHADRRNRQSTTTGIETRDDLEASWSGSTAAIDNPLQQGLKQFSRCPIGHAKVAAIDNPLQQGLKRNHASRSALL